MDVMLPFSVSDVVGLVVIKASVSDAMGAVMLAGDVSSVFVIAGAGVGSSFVYAVGIIVISPRSQGGNNVVEFRTL